MIKVGEETRPPPGASAEEYWAWKERQKPFDDAMHEQAGSQMLATTLFVGLPISILLIIVCVLLYRIRVWLRRGA